MLATLLAAMAALVVAFPGNGTAADPDIGPLPSACPAGTPAPYRARHDYCVRTSEYATLSVDPATVGDGSEFTVTVGLATATCARLIADRVYPCVESIGWSNGGELCGIGSRLIANDRTFFTNSNPPSYYRPYSIRPVSPCRIGTVDPSTDLTRVFKLEHNPGIGPIPASWFVIAPEIRVQLSATEARFVWPEAVARLSPTPVDNAHPSASFTWEPETDDPLTIDFDASASSDDKGITRYEWEFDDGDTGTGQTAQHTFTAPGTYHVRLTVFDAEGLSSSTARDVVVQGHSIALSLDAATPQPQGVQRTQRIVYTIDAQPDERADELIVSATVPTDFVEVDESTIPGGGILSSDGKTVEWTLTNSSGTDPPLSFAVTVRADVPRSVLFISTQAHAHATFAEEGADASVLRQTPLIQFGLVLVGDFVADRGDHVVPKDVATIRLQADARESADEIVLEASVPKSSNLVPNSITAGGLRDGERWIRWRFENVRETPVVTFQIKVDALEDIPKERRKLQSKTTARATFDEVPESAENTIEIDLVRPTTIRGVTLDIVNPSPRLSVSTPPLGGINIRLSELLSGRTVQTAVSAGDGTFSVEAGEPMRYVLEAFRSVAVESLGGPRQVRSKHILEVRENGEVFVDGRAAVTREDGSLAPLDVHVPVSLVARTDALIVGLGKAEIPYWIFLKFDAGRVLDYARSSGIPVPDVRFDTTQVEVVLETVLALQGPQIDSTGQYQAHFNGIYEPGNPTTQRDGWNALVRLNSMLVQLGADDRMPMRFGDAVTIVRPVALAVALQATTMVVKAVVAAINAKLQAAGKKPLARLPIATRFQRIVGMTDGIGFLAPHLIDALNGLGLKLNKGDWIEWIAKGTRYGMDAAFILLKKVGAVQTLIDDLAFEAIFNVVRIGVTGLMLQGWIDAMAQKSLDSLGFLKTTFAGSSFSIDQFILDTDARLSSGWFSAGTLQKLSSVESTVVSMIRGLDGVYQLWRAVYGYAPAHIDDIDIDPRRKTLPPAPKLLKSLDKVLTKAFGAGKDGDAAFQRLALAVNVLAVETGIVGLEALGLEVQKIAGALTVGVGGSSAMHAAPAQSARRFRDGSADISAGGTSATLRSGAASSTGALQATLRAYLRAATSSAAALRGAPTLKATHPLETLVRAAGRAAGPLELAVRRALLLQAQDMRGRSRLRTYGVVTAAHDVAEAQLAAMTALGAWQAKGGDGDVSASRHALTALAAKITRLQHAIAVAPMLGRRLAGTLATTLADVVLPSESVIRSGRPFTVKVTIWNTGDTPTEPGVAALTLAPGLRFVGSARRAVGRLLPGKNTTVGWRIRATLRNPFVASQVSVALEQGSAAVASLNVPVLAFPAKTSG